jgi:serine/threonine protein kinase
MATSKIGRYEIKSEIAKGGMATVFRAYDPTFERDVAIKVLPHAMLHDPTFRARFEREAKMIAMLEHPAIVPVYDFGEEDGQPYIVMRFMSGGSLAERIERGALPLDETTQIINRFAPALDAAHARNIIHRDLKPGNVLFDQYGNAYLSDFGIARLSQEQGATLTGGAIIGTPSYMSPEQIQGEKHLDGRSDIYAMGVLVYQMLSGNLPYQSDTPAKVMMMHVLEPVPDIMLVKSNLPESCQWFIRKAMAKKPEERYATAGEMAAAFENIARGESISTGPSSLVSVAPTRKAEPAAVTRIAPSRATAAIPQSSVAAVPEALASPHQKPAIKTAIFLIIALMCVAGSVIGGMILSNQKGGDLLAFLKPNTKAISPTDTLNQVLQTNTNQPTNTMVIGVTATTPPVIESSPTVTQSPIPATDTPTPTLTAPVIGGADKIAFLKASDIYIANLDGSELTRLTEDGTTKSSLQWTPDGQAVDYISGKCVQTVRIQDGRIDQIVCFNFVDYLKSFEISPDGLKVAISLDNQLYIVPYDVTRLVEVKTRGGLTAMA